MAVGLLMHPSILTKGEVMEWFLVTACLYEEFDAELHVPAAAQVFKDGITFYYTRIRAYLERTEEKVRPRITTIPEDLAQRLVHLREVTRHRANPGIIPEQDAGLTGCRYELDQAIDFQGNSFVIYKTLRSCKKRSSSDFNKEITMVSKKPKRDKQPAQPLYFFCGRKGHQARDCKRDKSEWIEVSKMAASVHKIAEKVRQAANRE